MIPFPNSTRSLGIAPSCRALQGCIESFSRSFVDGSDLPLGEKSVKWKSESGQKWSVRIVFKSQRDPTKSAKKNYGCFTWTSPRRRNPGLETAQLSFAMNGVEAISTDQLKQRMLEGQGGGEMQTSSCCIASPIASFAVLYQAHGCWCFYNSFYVSKIYKERPGSFLSAFCWAQNLLQEVHEVVQHMSWASRLFWCGAELSKMTLATVEGYCIGMCLGALLPVCVIDRQTLDTFLCKIY